MRINTATIEGFDGMSVEEKLAAVLGLDLDVVEKAVFDKKASEASELSKRLKSKMTDDEAAAAAQKEAQDEYQRLINEATARAEKAERSLRVSELTGSALAMGYDQKNAAALANALADGNAIKVMELQKAQFDVAAGKLKADLMRDFPQPGVTSDATPVPENVAVAKSLGAAKAAGVKANSDVMTNYTH